MMTPSSCSLSSFFGQSTGFSIPVVKDFATALVAGQVVRVQVPDMGAAVAATRGSLEIRDEDV